MKVLNQVEERPAAAVRSDDSDPLQSLVVGRAATTTPFAAPAGVVVGELVGMTDQTPLVTFPGQPGSAAIPARSIVDLHGAHIGKPVVLAFDGGDVGRPIVMGVVRVGATPVDLSPGQVELDADGARLIVTAQQELVLRCGKASITLTKTGKVLLDGTYISSRSSGVNKIKGGSVHIN
jgi:hypothetical protein